ncbi:hypothetical protein [Nitrospira sp. BLG_2]|uniref:hypothetical protein n=1 Tax=Nitrospira sp. BLG_2 TaxID=3397507 RepID=UPI003B993D60
MKKFDDGKGCGESNIAMMEHDIVRLRRRCSILTLLVLMSLGVHVLARLPWLERASADDEVRADPSVLRAESLQIVNNAGRTVLELGSKHGNPYLVYRDGEGNERAALRSYRYASDDYGPAFEMYSPKGEVTVKLGCNKWSEPFLLFKDKDQLVRVFLGIANLKRPTLQFFDDERKVCWRAGAK